MCDIKSMRKFLLLAEIITLVLYFGFLKSGCIIIFSIILACIGIIIEFIRYDIESKKIRLGDFLISQLLKFVSIMILLVMAEQTNIVSIIPYMETINYFEMGSFSLVVSAIILGSANNDVKYVEFRRAGFISLIATSLFFSIGVFMVLLAILSSDVAWFKYFQNSGLFLGTWDLFLTVNFLLNFFKKKYIDKYGF